MRARDLGVPFDGQPGTFNAITDVAGVEVGHCTLIRGSGAVVRGQGPVRTGVTVIHPRGRTAEGGAFAGRATINGTGEWTGMHLVDEIGRFFGPIALTGTGNLGLVHQALVEWGFMHGAPSADERYMRLLAVVAETLDAQLNDVFGHPMRMDDVFEALDGAAGGAVAEGNVGGGTGMAAYEFKGGIGTASRIVQADGRHFAVGALLQANHGRREDLRVAGVPVGPEIRDLMPERLSAEGIPTPLPRRSDATKSSVVIVLATDAPLLPHQLQRLARRAALGIGRNGSTANNLSGEIVLAFSTTEIHAKGECIDDMNSDVMNVLFAAATQSVEEALVNQLVASVTMEGADRVVLHALPHERLVAILRRHQRWCEL
jgi:L-aminopeptidase/D-esterase-like protein